MGKKDVEWGKFLEISWKICFGYFLGNISFGYLENICEVGWK